MTIRMIWSPNCGAETFNLSAHPIDQLRHRQDALQAKLIFFRFVGGLWTETSVLFFQGVFSCFGFILLSQIVADLPQENHPLFNYSWDMPPDQLNV